MTEQYLPDFPPSPKATFRLLNKLDLAFASLLQGRHIETGDPLPGADRGAAVSATERVRMKSIVDQTRVCVVNVIGNAAGVVDEDDGIGETEDDSDLADALQDVEDVDDEAMGIAKVYDKTISELGALIGDTPIGIITEE